MELDIRAQQTLRPVYLHAADPDPMSLERMATAQQM